MYTLTFNEATLLDLWDHHNNGRQFFGALVVPYSGLFTNKPDTFFTEVPKILCPYQINDIIIIQEKWAKTTTGGYIYKLSQDYSVDPIVGDFDYLPAYTMPDDAARMYGRIVSAVPWMITSDIANKYIPSGENIDSWAGTAKVISNTDTGTRLLNNIRKKRNQEVLSKTYQPRVKTSSVPTIKYVPYQLNKPVKPRLSFISEDGLGQVVIDAKQYTDAAQAWDWMYNLDSNPCKLRSGYPISMDVSLIDPNDYSLAAWATYPTPLTVSEAESLINSGVHLKQRGLANSSPTYDRTSSKATFVYVLLDEQDNAIPIYVYYPTETIDSNQQVFAWLISGYLCNKDGTILGDLF